MRATLLRTIYTRNRKGLPVLGTPEEAARRFAGEAGTERERSEALAVWYISFCGAAGFVCGLPGWLMLPVTVPANIAGVAALQMHMVQAIAVLNGRDLDDLQVRDTCVECLLEKLSEEGTNSEEEEVLTRAGIKFLERGARFAVGRMSSLAGRAARSALIRRLRLSRLPLFGGIVGAGSDAYVTRHVARCAIRKLSSAAPRSAA